MKSSESDLLPRTGRYEGVELDRLIEQLNTVTECEQAAARLVWCGPRVIPVLRRFLLEGKPSVVYQPRKAAVEALGGLRAKDVLVEYLTSKRDIADAATRFAEESVKNTAARELAKFQSKDVLDVLLSFALPHSRPGIVEALGQFGSMEAIPYFLRALEDDLCQEPAAHALRCLGKDGLLALVTTALARLPSAEEERPSSLRRRAKALELIAEIGASPTFWPLLSPLLDEDHPPIIAGAAKLAVLLGDANDRVRAAQQLVSIIPHVDWYIREEIQTLLIDLFPEAEASVEHEYQVRSRLPELERTMDATIRLLESVRRKTRGSVDEGLRR